MKFKVYRGICCSALALLAAGALANDPQSAGYRIEGAVFNLGGREQGGSIPTSTGYSLTNASLGDGMGSASMQSANFAAESGFPAVFAPSGEATELLFDDPTTLRWSAAAGSFAHRIYAGGMDSPASFACRDSEVPTPTVEIPEVPAPGSGLNYLAVGLDRLARPGSAGSDSDNNPRSTPSCP